MQLVQTQTGILHLWASELVPTRKTLVRTSVQGYLACCEAIRDANCTDDAANISVPVPCIESPEFYTKLISSFVETI